jgi:hypothetical protein
MPVTARAGRRRGWRPGPRGQSQAGPAADAVRGASGSRSAAEHSKFAPENKVYPYLLGGLPSKRVNQVWCADMAGGFLYLVVIRTG